MPVFIVGGPDSGLEQQDFVIIRAISKEDALNLYARKIGIQDETFLEFVYEKSANVSFAERFWLETEQERQEFSSGGDFVDDEVFSQRVRLFFREHSEWAETFLEAYFGDSPDEPMSDFPKDMFLFMFMESWVNDVLAIEIEVPTRDGEIGLPVSPIEPTLM